MILPLLVDAAGIFIMKQFFESVPREVEEAARVDGAGVFRIFWSVVLPMARPALITLTILSFQGSWNEFTHFLVATQSGRYETLTTGLARFGRRSRRRHAVSPEADGSPALHHPGGGAVLLLPALLRAWRQRGGTRALVFGACVAFQSRKQRFLSNRDGQLISVNYVVFATIVSLVSKQ